MKAQNTKKSIRKITIVLVIVITTFALTASHAQNFHKRNYNRGSSNPIAALTFGLGTHSFLIKSDIDYINNMKASLTGWESALMFGGNNVRVRTGFGLFKSELSDVNSIKRSSISGMVNIYVPGMTKHFRPYAITGLGVNITSFTGTFVPKSRLVLSNPLAPCTCQLTQSTGLPPPPPGSNNVSSAGLPPPPPNPGDEETTTPEAPGAAVVEINTSRMTSTQLVGGLGGEYTFRMNGRFFSMIGEARYGLPIVVTTQNASMNETKTKNNIAISFGVAIGLNGHNRIFKNGIR